jgi:hypothetical protein
MSNTKDDPLCLVFIPALVTLLYHAEKTLGIPLTEAQVLAIRDDAHCIALPSRMAAGLEKERGYPDIVAEQCWPEWQVARETLFQKRP